MNQAIPCYLNNFDMPDEGALFPIDEILRLGQERGKLSRSSFDSLISATDSLLKEIDSEVKKWKQGGKDRYKESQVRIRELDEEIAKLKQKPFLRVPYIGEDQKYLLFTNPEGDGYYPILETENNSMEVIFLHGKDPVGTIVDTLSADGKIRIKGKIIGKTSVESGDLIIADPRTIELKENTTSDLYCRLNLTPGVYSTNFTDNGNKLLIRRAE